MSHPGWFGFPGEVDHGSAVLRPDPAPGGGHCEAVCGRVHRLDDGSGVPPGLHAPARRQGAQPVRPDHPQAPLQRLPAQVRQHGSTSRRGSVTTIITFVLCMSHNICSLSFMSILATATFSSPVRLFIVVYILCIYIFCVDISSHFLN